MEEIMNDPEDKPTTEEVIDHSRQLPDGNELLPGVELPPGVTITCGIQPEIPKPPWWKRQIWRWFPGNPPVPGKPPWAEDAIYTRVGVYVDWGDRLRILISGRIEVLVMEATEFKPGKVEGQSSFAAIWPKWAD